MCSIPYKEILPQNVFFLAAHCQTFLVALSSLNYQDFCPFYTNQYPPKGYDWHR